MRYLNKVGLAGRYAYNCPTLVALHSQCGAAELQWFRKASISSLLFIFERPEIPTSAAQQAESATVRSW